jgi:hypothetical protein
MSVTSRSHASRGLIAGGQPIKWLPRRHGLSVQEHRLPGSRHDHLYCRGIDEAQRAPVYTSLHVSGLQVFRHIPY